MAGTSSRLRARAPQQSNRPSNSRARRPRNRVSYNENTSGSEESDDENSAEDLPLPSPVARTRRAPAKPTTSINTKTRKRKASGPLRKAAIGEKRRKNIPSISSIDEYSIHLTGKAMPWTTLPYHVLAAIFAYASFPLVPEKAFKYNDQELAPAIAWLIGMALVSKAFTEPALAALYFEPPIFTPRQIQRLESLLKNQDSASTITYRGKIKCLQIGPLKGATIDGIIPVAPQLRGITLGLRSDDPKVLSFFPSGSSGQPRMTLYSTMQEARTQLERWTWNGTLAHHILPLSSVKEVHQSIPFQTLKTLTFIDYHLPEMVDYDGHEARCEDAFADTLKALPSLRKLEFHLSDIVNERLMPLLPNDLEILVLNSCYNLFAPALAEFLIAKGQHLRKLILSHDQSLSLSFLTNLSKSCPKLETLKMDLLYYSSHTTYDDSGARYQSLLIEGEQPSWPKTLRHLELLQLRKWNAAAAELFFSSFVDMPGSLPDLRYLVIKGSIDESSWRDRIAFRDKWKLRLEQVFLRTSAPPRPYLKSIAAFKAFKAQERKPAKLEGVCIPARPAQHQKARETAAPVTSSAKPVMIPSSSDSDAPLMKVRRSARAKPKTNYTLSESDSPSRETPRRRRRRRRGTNESSSEDSALEDDDTELNSQRTRDVSEEDDLYVQGLCDVVVIEVDNKRPAEEQLNEADFLDEERSGDEDWNGDDDAIGDGYAW